jgi:hypothetical protein
MTQLPIMTTAAAAMAAVVSHPIKRSEAAAQIPQSRRRATLL